MPMNEKQHFVEFAKRLAALGEIFGKELGTFTVKAYWAALRELSWDEFDAACTIHLRGGKFFPRPAELIESVMPDSKGKAALAFDRMISEISSHGTYRSLVFDDPTIHAVIESLGGLAKVGETVTNDFFRREAERLYQVYSRRIQANGVVGIPTVLIGRIESANAKGKFSGIVEDPVMIGDRNKIIGWTKKATPGEICQSKTGSIKLLVAPPKTDKQ